jgi:transposase-like protein
MKKQRKHYTPEEKVAILRRHLLEQVPISKLCDELGVQPTVFYRVETATEFLQRRPKMAFPNPRGTELRKCDDVTP